MPLPNKLGGINDMSLLESIIIIVLGSISLTIALVDNVNNFALFALIIFIIVAGIGGLVFNLI